MAEQYHVAEQQQEQSEKVMEEARENYKNEQEEEAQETIEEDGYQAWNNQFDKAELEEDETTTLTLMIVSFMGSNKEEPGMNECFVGEIVLPEDQEESNHKEDNNWNREDEDEVPVTSIIILVLHKKTKEMVLIWVLLDSGRTKPLTTEQALHKWDMTR